MDDRRRVKEVSQLQTDSSRRSLLIPASSSHVELVEKKSRFIGHVAPVFSTEEAESFIQSVKEQHKTATHNVYAYVTFHSGAEESWDKMAEKVSDDGEPHGTAGYPVLHAIKSKGFCNVVCVVTRYFGGILLGSGGLIRAYGRTASMALEKAGARPCVFRYPVRISLDYQFFGKVKRDLESMGPGYQPFDFNFQGKVNFQIYVEQEKVDFVIRHIKDLTQGTAELTVAPGRYVAL